MSENQKKIVLVEDNTVLIEIIDEKLKKAGYIVITAKDGQTGIEKIRAEKPDLVLLDVIIPEKDGYAVLEEMRSEADLALIPVILMSNTEPDTEKMNKFKVNEFLDKTNLTPDIIIKKIQSQLEQEQIKKKINNQKEKDQRDIPTAKEKRGDGKKIMLVEDDEILRELCVKKFSKENFQVITAIDGQEGIEKIEAEEPDLILLDIILPGLDGFEILAKIRQSKNPKVAKTPVILLTNLGQENDVQKGEKLGAQDYIVKANSTTEEIVTKIRKAIQNGVKDKKIKKE